MPRSFVLYDGTALALRLGHRQSVDFDFFQSSPLSYDTLDEALPWLADASSLQVQPNARTVLVTTEDGVVKVSFFGDIRFGRVGSPSVTEDGVLLVASLLDLAGTKVKALLQRVESKDYLDIAAILKGGLSMDEIVGAAETLFGPAFNPLVARKTLTWFEGGDLATLPDSVRQTLVDAASQKPMTISVPRAAQTLT